MQFEPYDKTTLQDEQKHTQKQVFRKRLKIKQNTAKIEAMYFDFTEVGVNSFQSLNQCPGQPGPKADCVPLRIICIWHSELSRRLLKLPS